jgi:glutamine amidotransferase
MIAIVNHGAGNIGSVANAIATLGYETKITDRPKDVLGSRVVILPGVGAAGDAMKRLNETGMAEAVRKIMEENRPLFAVCLGLQLLFSNTEENGFHSCLDVIKGTVKRLPQTVKVPHMGWNQVKQRIHHRIFQGIPDGANFYFVHSYYAEPFDKSLIAATTEYGVTFCSMLIKGNLVATQFHPEKSGKWGLKMYQNFLEVASS